MNEPSFIKLPNRGLVRISGEDRHKFLQELISNDVNLLDEQLCIYACLLTPNGKFLHDFFVTDEDDTLLLECEGGARAEDLTGRLNRYRLRSRVQISAEPDVSVYAVLPPSQPPPLSGGRGTAELLPPDKGGGWEGGKTYPDPRHPEMGYRTFKAPPGIEEKPFEDYDRHRIRLGIPDGSRDMIPERSTLLESNIDKLNGISFNKGCYMGQELTARMHYRGLAKKHLYPVKFEGPVPQPGAPIEVEGKTVGEMRSSCRDLGMALLKDEYVEFLVDNSNLSPVGRGRPEGPGEGHEMSEGQ